MYLWIINPNASEAAEETRGLRGVEFKSGLGGLEFRGYCRGLAFSWGFSLGFSLGFIVFFLLGGVRMEGLIQVRNLHQIVVGILSEI